MMEVTGTTQFTVHADNFTLYQH